MNRKPFKFKERVIVSGECSVSGKGRIWECDDDQAELIGIRFDKNIDGHDLKVGGHPRCRLGHGWYVERKHIRRAPKKS